MMPPIDERQAFHALLRTQFSAFLPIAYRAIGGDGAFQHNWHLDAIAWQLDRVRSGDSRRLIITMPPRHLKSLAVSTAWVAWMLGHNPALRFICVSYGSELAEKHARDTMRIMESGTYRTIFPRLRLTKRSILDFETSAGGGRLSTSLGGVLTGRGADIIIIDDPIKADDALSETARTAARDWLFNTLMSRLNDQERGAIILVMQRLHEADLAGELLERGGWFDLKLPAIATEDARIETGSGRFYMRRAGRALHPARQSLAILEAKRAEDSRVFAAQYQQTPVPAQGNLVNPAWFGTYDDPPITGPIVQSWDTASKAGLSNDFSVGITARYYQNRYYILNVVRRRMEFGELRETLALQCARYSVGRLLIEDAASGQQLLQILRQHLPKSVPFPQACRPESDKVTRFAAQASKIQAGEVVLPRAAPWLADFITEIAGFPNAKHDDQADALAQMLRHPPWDDPMIELGFAGPRVFVNGERV